MSTTLEQTPKLPRPEDPVRTSSRKAITTILLGSGIAASLTYVAANVFSALRWEGYSTVNQAVSELSAIDAPSRPLMVTFLLAFGALSLAFGIGVLWSAGQNHPLRITAWALVAIGVVNVAAPLFPMHMRGAEATWTDTAHKIVTGVNVVPFLLAMGLSAWAFGKRFRLFSLASLVVMMVFGAIAAMQADEIEANLPTPWHGVYERIMIGGYLLWMGVLAVVLLRERVRAAKTSESEELRVGRFEIYEGDGNGTRQSIRSR